MALEPANCTLNCTLRRGEHGKNGQYDTTQLANPSIEISVSYEETGTSGNAGECPHNPEVAAITPNAVQRRILFILMGLASCSGETRANAILPHRLAHGNGRSPAG